MPREGERGKARIAAQQFLIKERVVGPAELSRVDFASLASRFSDLAGLPFQEARMRSPPGAHVPAWDNVYAVV
jgi:hypothetical protein